jgi:hypothetical protein
MLVGCVSFAGDQIECVLCLRTRLLWLPPKVVFFSHIGGARCYCSSMSSPSDTTRSLSAEGHSYSDNNTRSFSLSSEGHSLDLCAQMSPSACPVRCRQLRALWGAKGARADIDRAILRAVVTAATPPLIILLGHARLVESPRQVEN